MKKKILTFLKNNNWFVGLLAVLLALVLFTVIFLLMAWFLMFLWNLAIVPLFGANEMSFGIACGVWAILCVLRALFTKHETT